MPVYMLAVQLCLDRIVKVLLQRKNLRSNFKHNRTTFSYTSLSGVFSFSISCFVLEILRFFETCKLGVSDVIYSRIINYIYQMVNISVNSRQKFFKLCMTIYNNLVASHH